MNYQQGDIFVTANPSAWLGRAINTIQRINSSDNSSTYTHAGIIISPLGTTYESLWTIRRGHISKYSGHRILIGRHKHMTKGVYQNCWNAVRRHEGQRYPWWRLILHLYRPLAKYISNGKHPVCSELVAKFLVPTGSIVYWRGKCPDDIADMIHKWRDWKVLLERR